jgi:hypothetical protein
MIYKRDPAVRRMGWMQLGLIAYFETMYSHTGSALGHTATTAQGKLVDGAALGTF